MLALVDWGFLKHKLLEGGNRMAATRNAIYAIKLHEIYAAMIHSDMEPLEAALGASKSLRLKLVSFASVPQTCGAVAYLIDRCETVVA